MIDILCDYLVPITFVAASGWMLANVLFLTYGSGIFYHDE
jgi:hypothetical protein